MKTKTTHVMLFVLLANRKIVWSFK